MVFKLMNQSVDEVDQLLSREEGKNVDGDEEASFDEDYPTMMRNFSKTLSLLFVLGTIMVSLGIVFSGGSPSTAKASGELQALVVEPPLLTQGQSPVPLGVPVNIRSISSGNFLQFESIISPSLTYSAKSHIYDDTFQWIIKESSSGYSIQSAWTSKYLKSVPNGPDEVEFETGTEPSGGCWWKIGVVDGNISFQDVNGYYLNGRDSWNMGFFQLFATPGIPSIDKHLQWTVTPV